MKSSKDQQGHLNRRTYWSNGLVTTREMSFKMGEFQEFMKEQKRRIINGPGIVRVELLDFRHHIYAAWSYKELTQ